jgi:hypothetical protein
VKEKATQCCLVECEWETEELEKGGREAQNNGGGNECGKYFLEGGEYR